MPEPSNPQAPAVQPDRASSSASAPATPPFVLRAEQLSDVGRARDHQEDAVGVFAPADPALLARLGRLYVVADGMGGHNAGEVASQAALQEIARAYYAAPSDDLAEALRQAFAAANQVVHQLSRADPRQTGMGTTATVAAVRGQDVEIANVGDSRAYLIRGGRIVQITEDHSWVEEQVRAGVLTPEQARVHPQRNVITRALGTSLAVEPDLFTGQLQEGDVLLLCSDGLTGHLADAELLAIAGQQPPEQAVKRLVDLANERGGADNISVIVVRAESPGQPPAAVAAPAAVTRVDGTGTGGQTRRLVVVAAAALLLVAAVSAAALLLARPSSETDQTPTALVPTETAAPAETATSAGAEVAALLATDQTPTGTIPPTATLAPTAASPVAVAQPTSPVVTPAPTRRAFFLGGTPTSTSTAAVGVEAPVLVSPPADVKLPVDRAVEFRWTGALPAGHVFEVRLWGQNETTHLGAAAPAAVDEGDGRWVQRIRVDSAPGYKGPGQYSWTVAILRPGGGTVRETSPRSITLEVSSAATPTSTPAPPTSIPTPPTDTPLPPTRQPPPTTPPTTTAPPTREPAPTDTQPAPTVETTTTSQAAAEGTPTP